MSAKPNNDLVTTIRSEAYGLQFGEAKRLVCPFCKAKHEQSFMIMREPLGLRYRCWRVKCNVRGFLQSVPNSEVYKADTAKKFIPSKFSRELSVPTLVLLEYLENLYSVTSKDILKNGWRFVKEGHRLAMPIFDLLGHEVGIITKRLSPHIRPDYSQPQVDDGPKNVVYWYNDVPKLHFPLRDSLTDRVVVVEDSISATKIAPHVSSCALLGTSMDGGQMLFLAKHFRDITFVLDGDATTKAIKLAEKCKLLFRNVKVVQIEDDPKDMDHQSFQDLITKVGAK